MIRALWTGFAALALCVPCARAGEIDVRAPDNNAPAQKWFQTESKGGLRYGWKVPKRYDGKTACNLTVILHGTGLDWRWGPANNPIDVFRPDDIVVSVDGTSPGQGTTRLFLGAKDDVEAFAAFLTELRGNFAVKDVFLYGHSQGGFFVVYFAGEHPDLVSGVVAHASGSWMNSKTNAPVKKVAIAFMHGTLDPVVPYRQSRGSRDAYAKEGFTRLLLRRLQNYNHWPNAVRANECLDWCEGITTDDPEAALAAAERIASPKPADVYQWVTVAGFSAARAVLRRFDGKGPDALESVTPKLSAAAEALIKKLEDQGSKHVKALEKHLSSKKDLKLGGDWLGHLIALREDFRGVESVEAYMKKIGYDETRTAQQKSADLIFKVWYTANDPKKIFETVVDRIGDAFLVEGYPNELGEKMKQWKADAKKLKLDDNAVKKFSDFADWTSGWEKGSAAYESLWKEWKGP
ncbi:MAG: alpha/beta fold hydrolase [Planctomycetes bacterium]|nr:alpha/beta fold hydrolase [Planctomycetota bacterium]